MPADHSRQEIHLGGADEPGYEKVAGPFIELLGRADLMDASVFHDDDAVGHGHGFHLVMGDIDKGRRQFLVEFIDLRPGGGSQFGIQVRQWFIQEEGLGITDHGSAQGDPLFLAAGESLWLTVQQFVQLKQRSRFPDFPVDLVLGHFAQFQRKGQVFIDRHVRIQRIILEHHGDVPLLGLHIVDQLITDIEFSGGDLLKARDHAQHRGFPAPRGTDQDQEFLIFDLQIELTDGLDAAGIDFTDIF